MFRRKSDHLDEGQTSLGRDILLINDGFIMKEKDPHLDLNISGDEFNCEF